MASSETLNIECLSQMIDSALSIWNDRCSDPKDQDCDPPGFSSTRQIYDAFRLEFTEDPKKYKNDEEFISSSFPIYDLIPRSKVLDDKKLFEAILFSRILDDYSEFDVNRRKFAGELVWVRVHVLMFLVSQNKIIYSIKRSTIDLARSNIQQIWTILRDRIRDNLFQAFGVSESAQEGFTMQPAKLCDSPTKSSGAKTYVEVKKLVLDELNSYDNLTPHIKHQFEFDLKVLNKDVHYWRERLDCLRSYLSTAEYAESQGQPLETFMEITECENEPVGHETQVDSSPKEAAAQIPGELDWEGLKELMEKLKQPEETPTAISSPNDCPPVEQLSGVLAAVGEIKDSIQCKESGLPSVNENLETLQETNAEVCYKVDFLCQTVDILKRHVKSCVEGIKRNETFLKALAEERKLQVNLPDQAHPLQNGRCCRPPKKS